MKKYLIALGIIVITAGIAVRATYAVPLALDERIAKLFSVFLDKYDEREKELIGNLQDQTDALIALKADQSLKLGGGFGIATCDMTPSTGTSAGSFATTTLFYLNPVVASTTLRCDTLDSDHIDLNLLARASTTATLLYEIQFSHNNIDWFAEDTKSVDSVINTSHGGTGTVHTIAVTSATTTRNIGIDPVSSRYMRIRFNSTGQQVMWAQAILRKPLFR